MDEKTKKISVCALTLYPYDSVPNQRYRIEQWEPYLKKYGIEIDYYAFADKKLMKTMPQPGKVFSKVGLLTKAFARRLSHLSKLKQYDVIIIYRAVASVGPALIERIRPHLPLLQLLPGKLRRSAIRLIQDDA